MKKFAFFLVIIFADFYLLAQSFSASVDNTTVGSKDQFVVSFTFSGQDINGLKNFSPPHWKDFLVLSGPNQSSSMQIINGAVSASLTYSYYLRPRATGNFTIPSASIEQSGKTFKTEPLTITVVKGSSSPAPKQSQSSISTEEIEENLFVRAFADKQRLYIGEQVTVTYKLHTRLNIASQMSVSKLPQYQGFWAEELETSSNILFETEVVNGKQFRVGTLKRVALFPSQIGELSVTPFELIVPVQIRKKSRSGSLFDDFFNDPFFGRGETIEHRAKSNTLKLSVLPLPENGKPKDFQGAVGNFKIDSEIDKLNTKTNEAITYKINISGTGNIKLINIPEINLPPGFDKYDPKTFEQINRTGKVNGKKTIEYLLIPRVVGIKEIQPITFSFFNPESKSYVSLSTKPYTITVEQGAVTTEPGIAGKENVKLLGQDIRFIKTSDTGLSKRGTVVLFSFGFWAAAVLPLFILVGFVAWKYKEDKLAGNLQMMRYQRARKIAKTRLKNAKKLMESKNVHLFYSEISQALYGYLEDKFHIPKAEFSLERAVSELCERNIDNKLVEAFKSSAEKCEFIRFAPQSDGVSAMNGMYESTADLIIEIEKSLVDRKNA
jgi:hypothetical protein